MSTSLHWESICHIDDIIPNTGVCAKIGSEQVAIFRTTDNKVFAVNNFDPCSDSQVLYRGIVGNIGEELVVASPVYKQHFSLKTGKCLQSEEVSIKTYPIKIEDNRISLGIVVHA